MRTHLLIFALLFAACSIPGSNAQAQKSGTVVVVVDIPQVMENNNKFNGLLKSIQTEIDAFDKVLTQKRKQVQTMIEELRDYKAGTPAYENLEREIAQIQSDVNVQMQIKRKNILKKEADVYYQCYKEVQAHVAKFSEQNGINLVLNFNSKEINQESRDDVIKGVNRQVVYQRSLNITKYIIDLVNKGAAPVNVSNANGTTGTQK